MSKHLERAIAAYVRSHDAALYAAAKAQAEHDEAAHDAMVRTIEASTEPNPGNLTITNTTPKG